MMAGSIRFRLTAWYASTLALVLSLFAVTAWIAMRSSVIETVDKDLRTRIPDEKGFIQRERGVARPDWAPVLGGKPLLGLGGGRLGLPAAEGRLLCRREWFQEARLPPVPQAAKLS